MKKVILNAALFLMPLALAPNALADNSPADCGGYSSCGYNGYSNGYNYGPGYGYNNGGFNGGPVYESPQYNLECRVAAGELQIRLSTLANMATRQQMRSLERIADAGATAAWNFKQICGASNIRDYLMQRLFELSGRMEELRNGFPSGKVMGEGSSMEALNGVLSAWDTLRNAVNDIGMQRGEVGGGKLPFAPPAERTPIAPRK